MNTLITLTILFGCFAGLNALTCHSCSYSSVLGSDECNDAFTANYSSSCSSSQDTCSKSVVKLDGSVTGLTRACTTSAACSAGCASIFSIESCTYCCTTDDCNGASALTFSLVTMVATAVGACLAHL